MALQNYWHRIEYQRRNELVHSEEVFDHGWYIKIGQEWKVEYTTACAAEYLHDQPGTWIVIVWRVDEDGSRGDCVCSIQYSSSR
jgi:hypothetical protein